MKNTKVALGSFENVNINNGSHSVFRKNDGSNVVINITKFKLVNTNCEFEGTSNNNYIKGTVNLQTKRASVQGLTFKSNFIQTVK